MVNAGLLPFIVMDEHKARFWQKIFPAIRIHEQPVFRQGGHRLGGAQESPQLLAMLNEQIAALRGKHSGDAILARYLKQNKFVKSAAADAERQKFLQVVDLFREYGEKYEVDWLLMAAQGYQESALNHKARSHVGAIGIMQIMPATGKAQSGRHPPARAQHPRRCQIHALDDRPLLCRRAHDGPRQGTLLVRLLQRRPRLARLRTEAKKRGWIPTSGFTTSSMWRRRK